MVQTLLFGLGLNTMQGREAKHIKLKKYMQNTNNVQKVKGGIMFSDTSTLIPTQQSTGGKAWKAKPKQL